MPEWELGLILAVLRIARGWSRDDLARAAGIPNSYLSEYERGRKTPELKMLHRLIGAMGYPLSALERTQTFLYALRAESLLAEAGTPGREPGEPRAPAPGAGGGASLEDRAWDGGTALRWEIDQVSAEAGRVMTRLTRTMFLLIGRAVEGQVAGGPGSEPPDPGAA